MKILTVVGARPQFIKAAVVSRALKQIDNIQEIILHTGQHYDNNMSDIFFEEMDIPKPFYNLAIQENLHGAMTGKMLAGIEEICLKELPDLVLVYGDTNSTLAASLAAAKLKIPVAHVESGLRSYNMQMPEEINRIITDKISSYLFCPTSNSIENLVKEGFTKNLYHVYNTGDVMYDAVQFYFNKTTDAIIKRYELEKENYILATLHRAENTSDLKKLYNLISALNLLHKQQQVIMPIHPRTRNILIENNINPEFIVTDPVGYFDMLQLIANSALIITDSGGLQKEAYFFKKFCIIIREETEWIELVQNHFSVLAGSDTNKITDIAQIFLTKTFTSGIELYGDGNAGKKIVDILKTI